MADFVFLQWIVNALMYPDSSAASGGGLVDLSYPISNLARRNLQVVGTIILKLASGSRFATYNQHKFVQLNSFLDSYQPAMNSFLRELIDVDDLEDHFSDVPIVQRRRQRFQRAAAFVSSALSPNAAPPTASSSASDAKSPASYEVIADLAVAAAAAVDEDGESDIEDAATTSSATKSTSAIDDNGIDEQRGVQRLEPLAVLPNDLFTIHRLLRSVLMSGAGATTTVTAAASASASAVKKKAPEQLIPLNPSPSPPATSPRSISTPGSSAPDSSTPAPIQMTTFSSTVTSASATPLTAGPVPTPAAPADSASTPASEPPAGAPVSSGPIPPPPLPPQAVLRVRLQPSRFIPLLTKTTQQLSAMVSKSRSYVTRLLVSIGDPTPYVSTADNQYVMLDTGVAMLDGDADNGGEEGYKAIETPTEPLDPSSRQLIDLFTSTLSTLRPLPMEYVQGSLRASASATASSGPIPLLRVLQLEAEREWALGNSARAAIIFECVERLTKGAAERFRGARSGASTPAAADSASVNDSFGPLLSLLLSYYHDKHRWLVANDACARATQCTGLIAEFSEWLNSRDKLCTASLLDCQVGRVLAQTQPKIRGLVSYLAKQDDQLSRTPLLSLATASSGGAIPFSDYLQPPPSRPATRATNSLVAPPQQHVTSPTAADFILGGLFSSRPTSSAAAAAAAAAAQPVFLPACAGHCPEALEDGMPFCTLPPHHLAYSSTS